VSRGEGSDEEEEEKRTRTGGQCSFPIFIPPSWQAFEFLFDLTG